MKNIYDWCDDNLDTIGNFIVVSFLIVMITLSCFGIKKDVSTRNQMLRDMDLHKKEINEKADEDYKCYLITMGAKEYNRQRGN